MKEILYPINTSSLLRKKKLIKKKLIKNKELECKNIAILGGSNTGEIRNILELFLLGNGIRPKFYESEYNRFYEESLFKNEKLNSFNPDIIYIHTTNVNIVGFPDLGNGSIEIESLFKSEVKKYKSVWRSLSKYNCAIIQNNFDLPYNRSLGNLDCYDIHGKTYFINKLNLEFSRQAQRINNLYLNDINYLSSYIGIKDWFDPSLWYLAKYAVSMTAIPELAFNISKIICTILGKSKKGLILDLDNTCWGGIIGDDGLDGIHIGNESAISEAHTLFQKYVKELHDRGITLAICSKNDIKNAKEGFDHPDSVLSFDDFTSFKANWSPKHDNIISIAKEINIGTDSLVFIDDNPVERDIVVSQIPSVSVPDIGNDIVNFVNHIDRNGYFETVTLSIDDVNRNNSYKNNKKILAEKSKFKSYSDFLISLRMTAEIKEFSKIYLNRIAQLTNKTNQFNLTTIRYTTKEIESIYLSDKYIKIYGRLKDKYSDHGLISIIIGRLDAKKCHIDLWLMSCRVFDRRMEFSMLDILVKECLRKNVRELIGYYYKTKKNNTVSNLYEKFDFSLVNKEGSISVWKLNISDYRNKNRFIKVDNYDEK